MSELNYIGPKELVFYNNKEEGIHSGGFSVNSIMMKAGMSPIMTMNDDPQYGGTNDKVSDLFNNLVVPNWALTYKSRITGGKYKEPEYNSDSDEDDVIHDDLHEKLLELVKEHNTQAKKKLTRKMKKSIIKNNNTKKRKPKATL
jgi:hypothetical protein